MPVVSPLHIWGAPRGPPFFFYGYFGLLTTVFENASILPGETDVVLNPGSPIELALSHGLTREHFSRNAGETMVHTAFQRVEKRLRTEFASFFATSCPEVLAARSACLRKGFSTEDRAEARRNHYSRSGGRDDSDGMNDFLVEQQRNHGGVLPELLLPDAFETVILIDTRNYVRTARSIQMAKAGGVLLGHASLRIIPVEDAPRHVFELSEVFYAREERKSSSLQQSGLELAGDSVTVNAHVPSQSFYSNPDLGYTEAHAVQTQVTKKFW